MIWAQRGTDVMNQVLTVREMMAYLMHNQDRIERQRKQPAGVR